MRTRILGALWSRQNPKRYSEALQRQVLVDRLSFNGTRQAPRDRRVCQAATHRIDTKTKLLLLLGLLLVCLGAKTGMGQTVARSAPNGRRRLYPARRAFSEHNLAG